MTMAPPINRVLKNKDQAVRQGARRYNKRSISICEHWREPRNAEWRPQAQFFNTLLKQQREYIIAVENRMRLKNAIHFLEPDGVSENSTDILAGYHSGKVMIGWEKLKISD